MDDLLDRVFAAHRPQIEALAKKARDAFPSKSIAMLLELRRNGELAGGCTDRDKALAHVRAMPGIDEHWRSAIVAEIAETPSREIPVVLRAHGPRGPEVGVVRLMP